MLTRLYVDNYRCMVNFEFRPKQKQLIIGGNGTGKSTFLDVLAALRGFVIDGADIEDAFASNARTRWDLRSQQTFLIEASVFDNPYQYGLVTEHEGGRVRVYSESLVHYGEPLIKFAEGEVELYNDRYPGGIKYPFDSRRSALATIDSRPENWRISAFKEWLAGLYAVRIDPYGMTARAEKEDSYPEQGFSNFASWYRHISQERSSLAAGAQQALRQVIDGFESLDLSSAGQNIRILKARFGSVDGPAAARSQRTDFDFDELSDGQRTIVALYMLLHCTVVGNSTLVLDEPDNFLALAEIQPWLFQLTDRVDDGQPQVILISHHPELINYFAAGNASRFVRVGSGPTLVEPFEPKGSSGLSPAELVARGWDRE
jgi:predicted ATPase